MPEDTFSCDVAHTCEPPQVLSGRKCPKTHFPVTWLIHVNRLITKPTKWHMRQAKTQISLGICPVWSESPLSAWRKLRSLATHWAHSKDSDQTVRMPRLIWVFAGHASFCWFCHEVAHVMPFRSRAKSGWTRTEEISYRRHLPYTGRTWKVSYNSDRFLSFLNRVPHFDQK